MTDLGPKNDIAAPRWEVLTNTPLLVVFLAKDGFGTHGYARRPTRIVFSESLGSGRDV